MNYCGCNQGLPSTPVAPVSDPNQGFYWSSSVDVKLNMPEEQNTQGKFASTNLGNLSFIT